MRIAKTDAGQQVMKDRSVPLSPRQRSGLILIDGKQTLEQVLQATAAAGVTRADIDRLLELGLIAEVGSRQAAAVAPDRVAADAAAARELTPQERYAQAYPIAIQLTSGLGLRGFRLNLAVEAAGSYEQLLEVAPRIREAVGAERYLPLGRVLGTG